MKSYLKLLIDTFGWKIPVLLGLLLVRALIQGIGVAMLIPLLNLLGDANQHTTGISSTIIHWINHLGLDVTLVSVLSLFLVLMLFNAIMKVELQLFDHRLQHTLKRKLKTDYLALMTHCQWTYYQQFRQSDLQHTLTHDISQINHGFYLVVSMVSTVLVTCMYVALAAHISWLITLITSVCSLLLMFGLRHKFRQAKIIGKKRFSSSRQFHAITNEHIRNMKLVKSFALEKKHLDHFSKVIRQMMHYQLDHHKNELRTRFYYEIGGGVAVCGIIYIVITYFQLATSELIVLILVFSRLFPRFQKFQSQLQNFMQILPIHHAFVEQTTFLKRHQVRAMEPTDVLTFGDAIVFKALSFRYPGKKNDYVLRDINFKILHHQTTAIIGPSGAGKSTLIDLLTGLHFPTHGSITIDGKALDKNNLPQWRQRMAYVTQDIFLFNDTLRNNLTWMVDQADDELIWQALTDAAADSIAKTLPQGLETRLGDHGVKLSGGEKQRVILARALICQPEILILDEATSELDRKNDAFIQQTIEQLGNKMTIVVVSHRLASIQFMDRIIVIKQGQIVESGAWKSLMNNPESYIFECINEQTLKHSGK